MSSFWNFITTLVPGTLARAEDVNTNLDGINTGFNLIETDFNKSLQVTNAAGVTDITENAAARANKLIGFDASGDVVLSTTIGTYQGNHADAAGTDYAVRDVVKDAAASIGLNNIYICNTAHTSTGDLATDIANWDLLIDVADVEADKVAAEAAAAAAEAAYDSFDDRYLGEFTTAAEPTVDNDGDPLLTGALYFNSSINRMKVYNGSSWQLTTANAADVSIADAGGYYAASEVESALQDIGSRLSLGKVLAEIQGAGLTIGSSATFSVVPYDAEVFDFLSEFTSGASSIFTAATTGYRLVSAKIGFISDSWSAGDYAEIGIFKNTLAVSVKNRTIEAAGSYPVYLSVTKLLHLNAGDTIEIKARQTSGATKTYNYGTGGSHTDLSIIQMN